MFRGARRPQLSGELIPAQLRDEAGTHCFYHEHPYAVKFTQWREQRAADPYLTARPTTAAQYRAHAALQEEISEDYARRQKPAVHWYELAVAADRRAMEYLRRAKWLEAGALQGGAYLRSSSSCGAETFYE